MGHEAEAPRQPRRASRNASETTQAPPICLLCCDRCEQYADHRVRFMPFTRVNSGEVQLEWGCCGCGRTVGGQQLACLDQFAGHVAGIRCNRHMTGFIVDFAAHTLHYGCVVYDRAYRSKTPYYMSCRIDGRRDGHGRGMVFPELAWMPELDMAMGFPAPALLPEPEPVPPAAVPTVMVVDDISDNESEFDRRVQDIAPAPVPEPPAPVPPSTRVAVVPSVVPQRSRRTRLQPQDPAYRHQGAAARSQQQQQRTIGHRTLARSHITMERRKNQLQQRDRMARLQEQARGSVARLPAWWAEARGSGA